MKLLSRRQILMLHSMLIAQSGGMDGLRDEGLLDSAVNTPLQAFGGQELYPTILEKAARLGLDCGRAGGRRDCRGNSHCREKGPDTAC